MELRCPVCEYPQADGRHLANHLAFTALVRGGRHEEWLDEHVPEWESMGEDGLTAALSEDIDGVDDVTVVESTGTHAHHRNDRTHQHHDQPHDHTQHHGHTQHHRDTGRSDQGRQADVDVPAADVPDDLSEETADVVDRARELTKQRRRSDDEPEDR